MSANYKKRRKDRGRLALLRLSKSAMHAFRHDVDEARQRILFILGCQRSGTTLLTRIFEADWNARVFGEFSALSSDDHELGLRLNSLDKVRRTFRLQKYPLLVAKPLVESHRARELLTYFPNCRIVWLYRHFLDVAASDLAWFGTSNGIDNIRPIVRGEKDNWRSQGVSEATRSVLERHFAEDMPPLDAAALFWYARNMLFFETGLEDLERVMLLRYGQLVRSPHDGMQGVYDFVGRPFPGRGVLREVDRRSVGKGRSNRLSPGVADLCEALLRRFSEVARRARPRRAAARAAAATLATENA